MLHSIQKSAVAYYFIYTLPTCRLKAAFRTILLSLYLYVKLEAEFSTINFRAKHSNTCLHVSFHQEKSCSILFYIHLHASVCRLKAVNHTILLSLYLGVNLEVEFSTFNLLSKHSNTCLHVSFNQEKSCCLLFYIHLHASVCRLKAAFRTILFSLDLCAKLEAELSTINLRSKHSDTCLHVSFYQEKSCCILFYIYTCMRTCVD